MKKKVIAILVSLILVFAMIPTVAFALPSKHVSRVDFEIGIPSHLPITFADWAEDFSATSMKITLSNGTTEDVTINNYDDTKFTGAATWFFKLDSDEQVISTYVGDEKEEFSYFDDGIYWMSASGYISRANNKSIAITEEGLYELELYYQIFVCLPNDGNNLLDYDYVDENIDIYLNNSKVDNKMLLGDSTFMLLYPITVDSNGNIISNVKYPEVWEPYYETLALKILASAEVEAAKMLEDANVVVEPVEEATPIELIAYSEEMIAPNDKNSVKVTWVDKNGKKLTFDGYECYRKGETGEYKFMFNTTNEWYYNTLIYSGDTYTYKVRGYNVVNGEKIYSEFSTETTKTVK